MRTVLLVSPPIKFLSSLLVVVLILNIHGPTEVKRKAILLSSLFTLLTLKLETRCFTVQKIILRDELIMLGC